MAESPVLYEVIDRVAWLTLNRAEAHNALNAELRRQLVARVAEFEADAGARVLVLTGAGERSFCAGADLKEMAITGMRIPPVDFIPQFGRTVKLTKPTIAAVNGHALGGGFLLAQNCDIVVAADTAAFGIPEIRWSRGAPWAVPLVDLIGPRAAAEILLTGDPISAQRAQEIGLVNKVVTAADLRREAQALAAVIAGHPPLAVAACLQTIALGRSLSRQAAYDRAEEIWAPVYLSEDAQEGPRAFREKRKPVWKGQ